MVLPEGYTKLQYIESTGTQYIDTGMKLNQLSKLEMGISHFNTNGNRKTFGSRTSATSQNFSVVSGPVGGTVSIVADFCDYRKNRLAYVIDGDEYIDISINNENLKINDTEHLVETYDEFETPGNAYLFNCSGTYPAGYELSDMRLYYCRVYDNGIKVREFCPCINPDGEIGLFDCVHGVFYGNAGTGVFIAGDEVLNLYANRFEYYGEVLFDLTKDTVQPETLVEGETAHDKTGKPITGTLKLPVYETWVFELENGYSVEKQVEVSA
jgi:hypothetical protein